MRYVKVAAATELAASNKKLVTVDGAAILLVHADGSYYAVDNTCPHMGGSLFEGKLQGTQVTCPRHGSVFDVADGRVIRPGTLMFIKVKVHDITTYPVRVEGADVLVGIE
jgi:3-phenylpropionate/trans-cinnamate dioxygenase ferredoxin subunit